MFEQEANDLINIIKTLTDTSKRPNTLIFGTVKTLTPLSVDIGNNVILEEEQLILGQMCKPHLVTIPHSHKVNTIFTTKTKAIGTHKIEPLLENETHEDGTKNVAYGKLNTSGIIKEKEIAESELESGNVEFVFKSSEWSEKKGTAHFHELTCDKGVSGTANPNTSPIVTETSITITDNGHKHIIEPFETENVHLNDENGVDYVVANMYPPLSIGDTVMMFAFNNYQRYYIAERTNISLGS